jgi:predicted permease
MGDAFREFRFAVRSLGRDRGLALAAVVTLALAIGTSTVVFSVAYDLLFHTLAAKDPGQLAVLGITDPEMSRVSGMEFSSPGFAIPIFSAIHDQTHTFDGLAGYQNEDVLIADGQTRRQDAGAWVTSNAFDVYGVAPLLGRGITSDDGRADAPRVFAIAYDVWRGEFNADPTIIGHTFTVSGEPRVLIGVMPPRFHAYRALVWLPLTVRELNAADRERRFLMTLGRVRRGVALQTVAADVDAIIRPLYPKDVAARMTTRAVSANEFFLGAWGRNISAPTLYLLLVGGALLLLIGCANVSNLLLVRATERQRELAVRAALGASHARLVSQLFAESLTLAIAGALGGCVLTYWGLHIVAGIMPERMIVDTAIVGLDRTAFAFALAAALFTTLVCGLAPVLAVIGRDLHATLAGGVRSAGGNPHQRRLRASLVIAEVAIAMVLLVAAGLTLRSLIAVRGIDLGFNPNNLVVARWTGPARPEMTQQRATLHEVLRHVKGLPGVVDAAATSSLPGYGGPAGTASVPGKTGREPWLVKVDLCDERLFSTLGVRVLHGSAFSEGDVESARRVVVVNRTLARTAFGVDDPAGQRLTLNLFGRGDNAYFIVGVVADVKNFGIQVAAMPMAYVPHTVTGSASTILARTAVDPDAVAPLIRQRVWTVTPSALVEAVSLRSQLERQSYAVPEFSLASIGAFAAVGLLLVTGGLFSVMTYTVSLLTQELGIRMALGADSRDVMRMLLWSGIKLLSVGAVIGIAASVVLTRFMAGQIWGVSVLDPSTYVAVTALLAVVGLTACAIPARRASSLDPLVALRYE